MTANEKDEMKLTICCQNCANYVPHPFCSYFQEWAIKDGYSQTRPYMEIQTTNMCPHCGRHDSELKNTGLRIANGIIVGNFCNDIGFRGRHKNQTEEE